MPVTARHLALVVGLGVGFAFPASAQPPLAHVSQVEGTVTRLHRLVPGIASVGVVLVAGDQIVTAVGRAELTFYDGGVMHLDSHTQVAIDGAARIRLIDGRISLRTITAYTAETATGLVHVLPEGVFELTANAANRDVLIRVVEGDARIESPTSSAAIQSTQPAFVSGPIGQSFVSPSIEMGHDSFVQWCHLRYLAIGFGRVSGPPPAFLPYAHPTFRQFAYERSLRKARFDRDPRDITIRGDRDVRRERGRGRDRVGTGSNRESGPGRRAERREAVDRDQRPRTSPPPAARPAPPRARGAAKGAAVRQP